MNFFYDEVMGEYITMTLSDDEGEDDYYNKETRGSQEPVSFTW
jgi:hypothetical protein